MQLFEKHEDGSLDLNPHLGQYETLYAQERVVAFIGGTQSGKTSWIPWWQVARMVGVPLEDAWADPHGPDDWFYPALAGGDHLAVAPSVPLFKLKFLPEIRLVYEETLEIGKYWASNSIMELKRPRTWPWPAEMGFHERLYDWSRGDFMAKQADSRMWSRVILRSAESPRGLESATARTAALDEAGQESYSRTVWEAINRRLALSQGPILIGTTPYVATGWLMELAATGSYLGVSADGKVGTMVRVGDPDTLIINVPSIVNPSFPPEEFERAKRTMHPSRFQMFYMGKFTRATGLVYPDFDPTTMVVTQDPKIDENWRFFGGVDWGWHNPFCALELALSPDGVLYVLHERVMSEALLESHGRWMLERQAARGTRWPWEADPSGKTEIETLKAMSLYVREADNSVLAGIDNLTELIRTNRLRVHQRCEKLLRDFELYVWEVGPDGETQVDKPKKVNDHTMDALRYGAMGAMKYAAPASAGTARRTDSRSAPGGRGPLAKTRTGGRAGAPPLPQRAQRPTRRSGP